MKCIRAGMPRVPYVEEPTKLDEGQALKVRLSNLAERSAGDSCIVPDFRTWACFPLQELSE
jgi:hypothetical protein